MRWIFYIALFLFTMDSFGQTSTVEPVDSSLFDFLNARDFTISKDGREAYFTLQDVNESISIIVRADFENGRCVKLDKVPFSGTYRDIEPFLAPDQLRLYFASNRPKEPSYTEPGDYDIWYVERSSPGDKWSDPQNPGQPINTEHNEFYPSLSNNRNMYFTTDRPGTKGKDDIYFGEWAGTNYKAPYSLSNRINTEGFEFNAFIDPGEEFIIYTRYSSPDGFGSGDLYISFRDSSGKWGVARNLGEKINSPFMEYCPFYDPSRKILYFTSRRSRVNSPPFKSWQEFDRAVRQYSNGLSRLYKVHFDVYAFRMIKIICKICR